ncbi:hypothetical protein WA158_004478 [Blastocystis sp. Blastoise]
MCFIIDFKKFVVGCSESEIKCYVSWNQRDNESYLYRICNEDHWSTLHHVPEETVCMNNLLVLKPLSESECSFTGYKCTNENGAILDDFYTLYRIQCDHHKYSDLLPVPSGFYCYNGDLIQLENQKISLHSLFNKQDICTFEGNQCVDSHGNLVGMNQCAENYVICHNGHFEGPYHYIGRSCFNGKPSYSCEITYPKCIENTIICSLEEGQVAMNACSLYHKKCDHGHWSSSIANHDNTYCYNGSFMKEKECIQKELQKQCTFGDCSIPEYTYLYYLYHNTSSSSLWTIPMTENISYSPITSLKVNIQEIIQHDSLPPVDPEQFLCLEDELYWTQHAKLLATMQYRDNIQWITLSWNLNTTNIQQNHHILKVEIISYPEEYSISIPLISFKDSYSFIFDHNNGSSFLLCISAICNDKISYLYTNLSNQIII